jgi:serine/threonine protein phosphatase PrpC
MLILTISILNVAYVNEYIFLLIISVFITIQSIQFKRPFYIITAFFITIYSITSTNNLIYIFVQILAYLGYLLNFNNIMKNNNNEIEFILEDINLNVATFCNFLNSFSDITYNDDYEKRVSTAIKILIESYCLTCKNRADCYANKKTKTYIYLKELLTKKNQINTKDSKNSIFECKNYFLMVEKALQLQKQYNLLGDAKIDDLKIFGICSSVQSYFVSMFEKISPDMIKLMNFKKRLIEENVLFTNFEHSITNETTFQFKIYAKKIADLLIIKDIAEPYFKKYSVNIDLRDGYINISPKRKFKILYDHAALSLNNCQISGDNILFKTLDDINFLCALSDGMGSGYYAYQLSQETLKMVDNITNCSISFDSSLQILNNFFKTRDLSDSYATLDLININLADGILNLYKLGSSTTYISRGEKIVPIYNNNLPFGISDLITKEEYTIADGDLIVLVSDGVNDYINEEVLIKYIESLKNEAPHKIVYEILQKIYYENGSTIKDDMSCIAIKIKKV